VRIGKFTALWTVQIRNITALYFTLRHSLALPTHPPSLNTHTVGWGTVVGPGTHVHKITYAPVVYMARDLMVSSGQYALLGRFIGVGPEFSTFLGPGMALASLVPFQGPKKSRIQGPPL